MRARRNTARKASLFFLAACAAAWGQSSSVTLTAGGGPWSASADAYPNILSNPYDCQNPGEPDNIGSMSVSLPTNSCSLTGEEIEVSCSNTSPVQPGTYTVTADYSGFGGVDENNNPCTVPGSSASANITVTAYTTSIALELPSSLTFQSGQTLTVFSQQESSSPFAPFILFCGELGCGTSQTGTVSFRLTVYVNSNLSVTQTLGWHQ